MRAEYRIISVGTLEAHPLWEERSPVRTGHCTTTLVHAGDERIVIDPSLPAPALAARFSERTRTRPDEVTTVFLTSFQPDHRRALELFPNATVLLHEPEFRAAQVVLEHRIEESEAADDHEARTLFETDLRLLGRIAVAPDTLAPGVDLFPLPGVTPGTCGLLLPLPSLTVVIAGDAVATVEHIEQGKVLPMCTDVETAQESFQEVVEIADIVVPGRDNLMLNPLRKMMI